MDWFERLTAAIKGDKKVSPKDVHDHQRCDFGHWYQSEAGQTLAHLPGFVETGRHHEEVHRLIGEIVGLVNQGENGKASRRMADFNEARTHLFSELDTLYCA